MPTIQQQINANNQTPQQQQQPTQTKQPQNLSEYKQQLKDTEQNLEEQKRKAKQRMVELGRIGRVNPRQRKSERTYYQNVKGQINKALPSIQQEISDVSGAEQVMAEIESGMITTTAQISPQASRFIDTQKADEYLQQKAEYDSQVAYNEAYNNVIKHYESGMLWAVAAYGEGLEQEIAKKMIKEGYSPSLGGLLETEQRQKLREQKQALTILNENLYSSAQGMSIAPELSTKQFIFPTGQVSTNEFLKGMNKVVQEAVSVNKGLFRNITGFSMFPLVSASGPETKSPAYDISKLFNFSEPEPQPYLQKQVVDNFEVDGKTYPITKTFLYEPGKINLGGADFTSWKKTEATPEQINIFQDFETSIQPMPPAKTGLALKYGKAKQKFSVWYEGTNPDEQFFAPRKYFDKMESGISWGTSKALFFLPGESEKKVGQFTGGAIRAFLPETKGDIMKAGGLLAIGGIAGFAFGAVEYGTTSMVLKGSQLASKGVKAGKILEYGGIAGKIGIKAGGLALVSAAAVNTGSQIIAEPDYSKKGEIFGETAADFVAAGVGYAGGSQKFKQFQGYMSTRGRTEIPTEKLVPEEVLFKRENFPLAPKNQQLALFENSPYNLPIKKMKGYSGKSELIYPESFGNLPFKVPSSAYHTSPLRFWSEGGILTPKAGTSELPGVYGSYAVSPHFAKVGGSSYKLFPSLKDLFASQGRPGIANIQPEGFRVVNFWTRAIKGSSNKYRWTTPAKTGYADLPLMKTEVEAIFRPDAGSYKVLSKDYYTMINGVRVPIDVFGFNRVSIPGARGGADVANLFSGLSYSSPSKTPLINLFAGMSSSSSKNQNIFSGLSLQYSKKSNKASSSSKLLSSNMFSSALSGLSSGFKYTPYRSKISKSPSSSNYRYDVPGPIPPKIPYIPYTPYTPTSSRMFPRFGGSKFKDKRKTSKSQYYDRTYEYAPSLSAVLLGLTASKAPGQKIFSGLELRPMIVNNPRQKIKNKNPFQIQTKRRTKK
jgi:hypothetical protein